MTLLPVEKMRRDGQPEEAVAAFGALYEQLKAGASGTLPDAELEPVRDLPELAALPLADASELLARACVIKLNGGLGTSMGVTGAKALLEAREGLSFLAIIARQVSALRTRHGVRLPLVLMHSFRTRAASLEALSALPEVYDFLQHRVPKLRADDLTAVSWPSDPALEWCPPGHGDLYNALRSSGTLARLLAEGIRYAFVSNADNLGAILDPRILAWFAQTGAPFAMETVIGTESDRKGGHIARRDGRLIVRETAQAGPGDSFTDFRRWRYYNTNNLWLDLEALARLQGPVHLPLIVNRKTVDPADPGSIPVIQTETAMSAALGVFEGAVALCVPRSRFVPVKTTDDLLLLRSDVFRLREDGIVEAVVDVLPFVALDPAYFRKVADFEARFPHGPVSLRDVSRFEVKGDVTFDSQNRDRVSAAAPQS